MKRATFSSLVWKILERGGNSVVALVVQVALAWLLAPEQFGALAVMLVFVNVANTIVDSGLSTALIQSSEASEEDCSTAFWMSGLISIVIYLVIFLSAPLIADFFGLRSFVWPLRVLALGVILNAYVSIEIAIVQRSLEFRKIFYATLASVSASGAIGIIMALSGAGLWALVMQQIFSQLINGLVLSFQVRWRPRLIFDPKRARELFSFGWKLLVSGLLNVGYQSLSDLIIGKQFSASSLGLVSQGKKYPQAVGSMLDGAIQPVMLSAVSRVQDDVPYVKRLVRRALKTSTFLIVPSMALFALVAEPLVALLLGEKWLPCVPFLQMYCFIYALLPIHTTNLQALNGMGRSDLFLKLELVKKAYGVVFLLVAAFVFKDVYVMVGTYMLTGVVSTFVNAWPNRRVIGYSYAEQVRDICPAFLLAAAGAALAWPVGLLGLPGIVTILLQAAVMAVAYLGLARLFKVEALSYLVATAGGLLGSRRARG